MKQTLKFLSSVLLISLLGLVNCSKYETGGNGTNGYLVSSYINGLIRTAVSGNCAISLNLGSLYAGAIFQGAVSNSTNFTETQYIAASGSTTTAQGYSSYAVVPYNKKYDAFLNTATGWAATDRNTALARQKAQLDTFALMGGVALLTSSGTVVNATSQAAVTAFYNSFSSAEKTAIVTVVGGVSTLPSIGGSSTVTALDTVMSTASGTGILGTPLTNLGTALGSAAAASSTIGSAYLSRASWRNGMALMGCSRIPRSSCSLAAIATGTRADDIRGQATVAGILINTPECRKNSSTTVSNTRFLTAVFAGLDKDIVVNESGFTYQNQTLQPDRITQTTLASVYGATEGGATQATSWTSGIPIIASKAYPKSSALTSLGFSSAFPLASGSTAYPVTAGTAVVTSQTAQSDATADAAAPNIPWRGGANINLTPVASCEALGMGSVGPTPITGAVGSTTLSAGTLPAMTTATVDSNTSAANRKPLSDVREILYAFSSQNSAASTYAALNGVSYSNTAGGVQPVTTIGAGTQGYTDAVACNTALRKNLPISSALGVGTSLPVIATASGDGSASTLLTACIYGGTATTRTAAASVLTTSLLNITSCPTAAAAGAATFGEYGLQSLSTATTPNAIDGKP